MQCYELGSVHKFDIKNTRFWGTAAGMKPQTQPTLVRVVLEGDHVVRLLLHPLQEEDDEVSDVLGVGGGEGVLISLHRHDGEALPVKLARSDS